MAKRAKNKPQVVAHDGVLEEMTIDEVRAMKPEVVVLPLGSTEPHGSALPHGTDNFEVTRAARTAVAEANRRGARALLYPTLPITNNANMRRIRFACRIGVRTLMQVILDIVTQCKEDGIRKVMIVNGHGGNPPALQAVMRELSGMEGMPFVCAASLWLMRPEGFVNPIEHASDHAGESEVSRMLTIRPDLVHTNRLTNNPLGRLKVKALAKTDFVRPWHLYMPQTAGGDTRASTVEKGRKVAEAETQALADILVELSAAKWDERFPYE